MNVHNSDKYEFVYPNYSLSKLFDLENNTLIIMNLFLLKSKKILNEF